MAIGADQENTPDELGCFLWRAVTLEVWNYFVTANTPHSASRAILLQA